MLLRTEADMVEAYRLRIRELNITYETVDAISGLPSGYTSKLMSPQPIRGLGEKAIEGLNGALGIGSVTAVDEAQVERVRGRWVKRRRAIDKRKRDLLEAASTTPSTNDQPLAEIEISAGLHAKMRDPEFMRQIGLRGNQARNAKLSPWHRKVLARRAARARWARETA